MKNMANQKNFKNTFPGKEASIGTPCPKPSLFAGVISLGEAAKINTVSAARAVKTNMFAHDVLNQIAKYRIRLIMGGNKN